MNPEYTHDMMIETLEGLLIPVYNHQGISKESITAIWGMGHWHQDMRNAIAGAG